LNFLDNSWDHNDRKSETSMGDALRDGYRQKVFLMTKFDGRTKESAAQIRSSNVELTNTRNVRLTIGIELLQKTDNTSSLREGALQQE
jgi:predicted aldo/keto reductase-like oxidoreductase